MAQRKITITTCDRCGHEDQTDSPAKVFVVPANSKSKGKTWELCDSCTEGLGDFLLAGAVDDPDGMD